MGCRWLMSIADPPPSSSIHHVTRGCTPRALKLNKIALNLVHISLKLLTFLKTYLRSIFSSFMWSVLCSLCWLMVCTNGRIATGEHALRCLSPVPSAHTHSPPEHMGCVKCQIKTDGSAITLQSLIMSPYCAAKFTSARL